MAPREAKPDVFVGFQYRFEALTGPLRFIRHGKTLGTHLPLWLLDFWIVRMVNVARSLWCPNSRFEIWSRY